MFQIRDARRQVAEARLQEVVQLAWSIREELRVLPITILAIQCGGDSSKRIDGDELDYLRRLRARIADLARDLRRATLGPSGRNRRAWSGVGEFVELMLPNPEQVRWGQRAEFDAGKDLHDASGDVLALSSHLDGLIYEHAREPMLVFEAKPNGLEQAMPRARLRQKLWLEERMEPKSSDDATAPPPGQAD